MDGNRDPDQTLVRLCQDPDGEGFEVAFEALYQRYRDRVYSIAFRIVGSAADARDVVQEGFSLLFRKIGTFRFDSLFSTWLFRLVVNCAIDHKRQRKNRPNSHRGTPARSGTEFAESEEPADPATISPFEVAASAELGEHVHHCLQKLSPKLRAILVLRYLESMSYEQLADTLGLAMGTVKSRLARAHLAIENVLRGTLAPFGFAEMAAPGSGKPLTVSEEGVA